MTDEEKYREVADALWELAKTGSPFQSIMASQIIRKFNIVGPEGEDPEDS